MNTESKIARSRAATRPILASDRGQRTDTLDLALAFDPVSRTYHRRGR